MKKAIFLDRDGTINREVDYLINIADFKLIPGTEEALHIFNSLDFSLFMVSNQSGIARGFFSTEQVDQLNNHILQYFAKRGIYIKESLYCPHHLKGIVSIYSKPCNCRKPRPGMLLELQNKYNLHLPSSYMVGDKISDAMAGIHAGTKSVLVKSGHALPDNKPLPSPVYENLLDFAHSLQKG